MGRIRGAVPHSTAYEGERTGDNITGYQAEGKGFAKYPNGDTYDGEFHLHLMEGFHLDTLGPNL